ncbi:helix-turn-helix transcriptional regulator [bacterium]|nr:helix-turn-helix transcriptional regulator [bacterium]
MKDIHEIYIKIGKNIKKYREIKGYTQQQLADKINKGLNFTGKIEVAYAYPSIQTLVLIADALNIKLMDLFEMED